MRILSVEQDRRASHARARVLRHAGYGVDVEPSDAAPTSIGPHAPSGPTR
ncbi:DNA-binding response OmpR family regulator [Kibdelosporangium banguiense]|uniref:DNA-binding response OmpR family regulator n=1 Tax=Kibdelosporangium banguiense TaxID=1365924 RepID=A0ABS4TWD7_9PSEU|nr:hypothetical protein [Kibdelosporangium banguiense]MBP2328705.1 DNA-binding response OmpR family regulator [Kibdelosporangium banguiense]